MLQCDKIELSGYGTWFQNGIRWNMRKVTEISWPAAQN